NQEEAYWQKHDESLPPVSQPQIEPSEPVPSVPQLPRTAPSIDNPARQVEMTSLPANDETYDGIGTESARGEFGSNRISPEQLPALLNANSASPASFAMVDGAASASVRRGEAGMPYPSYGPAGIPAESSFAAQSGVADASRRPRELNLQAKMEMQRRQLPSAEDLNLDRPQIRRKVNPYA